MSGTFARSLVTAGMSSAAALAKDELFTAAVDALRAHDVSGQSLAAWFSPGRIEVLGKHTDYAGGRSLLCAVERGVCLAASPRADGMVRVIDTRLDDSTTFPFGPDIEPPMGRWSNYPMTVVRRVARNFPTARRGLDIALASDLPLSAGVSSSSALVVAIFLAISYVNDLEHEEAYRREITDREALASYLGCVENGQSFGSLTGDRGVGIFGGSEDQTAILCCAPQTLSQYAFCPVRAEGTVRLPDGYTFVDCQQRGAGREGGRGARRLQPGVGSHPRDRATVERRHGAGGRLPGGGGGVVGRRERSDSRPDPRGRARRVCAGGADGPVRPVRVGEHAVDSRGAAGARRRRPGPVRRAGGRVAVQRGTVARQSGSRKRSRCSGRRGRWARRRRRHSAPGSAAASGRWCRRGARRSSRAPGNPGIV